MLNVHVSLSALNLAQVGGSERSDVTVVMLLFGVGAVLFGAYFLRRVGTAQWRGEYTKTSDFWGRVWGPRWGKAAKAVYPYAFVGILSLGPMLIFGYIEQVTTGAISDVFNVLSEVSVALFFVAAALFFSILMVNRPRFLVPPHARDFHGLFGDWVISGVKRLRHSAKHEARDRDSSD